jgi:hypothetical protein
MGFAPLVTPPHEPLALDGVDCFVVPVAFGEMAGHGRARDAVRGGFTRPADIDKAELGPVERIFVPLWRVEGSSEAFHVGLTSIQGQGRSRVLPTGGFRHLDRTVLVAARRNFPIDPSQHTAIDLADARPAADLPIDESERVVPDVPRASAESEAHDRFRRLVAPSNALYAKIDVRIRSASLVWLPLYVVRYRYAGEANQGVASEYHVAISARDGKQVSERRPPLLASLASRVRSLF